MTLPERPRPEVRLVGDAPAPPAPPGPSGSRRVPVLPVLAGLLVLLVVVSSVEGQRRDREHVRRTTVQAVVVGVGVDDALRLDLELDNRGPPARVVDARLLLTGAQERDPLHLVGQGDVVRGHAHLVAALAAQCGPEGPLSPFEGEVVVHLSAGGAVRELSSPLPVERARVAAERECRPLQLSAGLARAAPAPGEVRLTLRVRTRAAAGVRTVQAVTYDGRPVTVLGAPLPFSAGVPGIDTVTSFGVVLPARCDGATALVAVLDGQPVPVELDDAATRALQAAQLPAAQPGACR